MGAIQACADDTGTQLPGSQLPEQTATQELPVSSVASAQEESPTTTAAPVAEAAESAPPASETGAGLAAPQSELADAEAE